MNIYVYMYMCIYKYKYIYVYIYKYTYIHICPSTPTLNQAAAVQSTGGEAQAFDNAWDQLASQQLAELRGRSNLDLAKRYAPRLDPSFLLPVRICSRRII